ncbi:MAG: type IV pilin-like G/H family protein [Gloeomargarita sp. SKYB120]|nr:type IV pilin-like G/H family protein [Gloeomargarita sp. SKYG98]MCS7292645.1 type IV pilin-like G/H family protein [Gloeomargarita sp. SKYB120]
MALPSFLDQSVRARQAEAKTTLNAWTKAQQLYRHEYGRFFSFHDLALGLPTDSKNYNYLGGGGEEEFADDFARLMAYSKNDSLKRYAAGVERDTVAVNLPDGRREYQVHNLPVLCESHAPGRGLAERPVVNDARDGAWPTCPAGYVNIFRP